MNRSGFHAGLERCGAWRASTSDFRRGATAGLFNSGTNLLTNLVRKNCVMPRSCPEALGQRAKEAAMARGECIGYPFQIPWGASKWATAYDTTKRRDGDYYVTVHALDGESAEVGGPRTTLVLGR